MNKFYKTTEDIPINTAVVFGPDPKSAKLPEIANDFGFIGIVSKTQWMSELKSFLAYVTISGITTAIVSEPVQQGDTLVIAGPNGSVRKLIESRHVTGTRINCIGIAHSNATHSGDLVEILVNPFIYKV